MKILKGKKILARISVIILVFLLICTLFSKTIYTANLPRVTVKNPDTKTELTISTNTVGEVIYDTVSVKFDKPLKIKKVYAAAGDAVAAGDIILEVDAREFQVEIKKMELAILQFKDAVAEANSEKSLRPLHLELEIAQDELDLYKESVPYDGKIPAGCEGTVSQIYVQEGQSVSSGSVLYDFIKQDVKPQVQFSLTKDMADLYPIGSTVYLTYSKMVMENGQPVVSPCREKTVITEKRQQNSTVNFFTNIGEKNDAGLQSGTSVNITAVSSSDVYDYIIPLSAVSETASGGLSIYALKTRNGLFGKEDYVEEISIEEIAKNNISMAISGEGITADLQIVISASRPVSEGQIVKVEE